VKPKILFVDDEPNVLEALRRILRDQCDVWDTHFAQDADSAEVLLDEQEFDVVVLDVAMPGRDGLSLLQDIRANEKTKDIPVIILTGIDNEGLKARALNLGATDLLRKPADRDELRARLANAVRLKSYEDKIKGRSEWLEQRVRERTEELEQSRTEIIWRLAKVAESRERGIGNHVRRVSYYSRTLADALGLDAATARMVFLTSPLHDIGKIAIPDRILLKNGKLNPQERVIIEQHCAIGAERVNDSETPPLRV